MLALDGPLAGTLVPSRALLHDASGQARSWPSRDGTDPEDACRRCFALALASDSLNPFSSRERIRYRRVDAALELRRRARVSTEALEIEGPICACSRPARSTCATSRNPVKAEIALFLFRQLDWALVKIPILTSCCSARTSNLVAAYFQLVGTWQEPVARAQPLRTLQDTAGGDLLEGIPRVMIQGMEAIGALLLRRRTQPGVRRRRGRADGARDRHDADGAAPARDARPRARARSCSRARRAQRGARRRRGGAASAWCSPTAASTCCTSVTCAASSRRAARATA